MWLQHESGRTQNVSAQVCQLCAGGRKPYLDEDLAVHWPVLFMYPESMQMDAIEDVTESDSLSAHLDVMFPPDAASAPEWDTQHEYRRDVLQLYYLSYAAQPLPVDQLTEVWRTEPACLGLHVTCMQGHRVGQLN